MKEYLTDFYNFCNSLGGTTAEVMSGLLEFQADMRAVRLHLDAWHNCDVPADQHRSEFSVAC